MEKTRLLRVVRALKQARALIANPAHWTRGSFARDAQNRTVRTTSHQAVQWCAIGALERAVALSGERFGQQAVIRELGRRELSYGGSIMGLNDRYGHAAVLQRFDEVIERLERKLPVEERQDLVLG